MALAGTSSTFSNARRLWMSAFTVMPAFTRGSCVVKADLDIVGNDALRNRAERGDIYDGAGERKIRNGIERQCRILADRYLGRINLVE